MSLGNLFNNSPATTSLPFTVTDLYAETTVFQETADYSLDAERNLTAGERKFGKITEEESSTPFSKSPLEKIKDVTASIINAISSTIIDATTERGSTFIASSTTKNSFSEDISTEEGSSASTDQAEDVISTTTVQIFTEQNEDISTTTDDTINVFQKSSSAEVNMEEKMNTTAESSREQSTTNTIVDSTIEGRSDFIASSTTENSFSEDISTEAGNSTFIDQAEDIITTTQDTTNAFQNSSSEGVRTQETTIAPPTQSLGLTKLVIAMLTGGFSLLVIAVGCVYRKINKPRPMITVRFERDRDIEMQKKIDSSDKCESLLKNSACDVIDS